MTGLPYLFFDLDGTLVDSLPGICRSINDALIRVGRPPVAESTARSFVGKPLASIFSTLLDSSESDLIERAVGLYRDQFDRAGMADGHLFPGVDGMLRALGEDGYPLRIVTAKPSAIARRVLACFDIADYFDDVHGPTLDDRHVDKAQLVRAALQASDAPAGRVVMIGDRAEDVLAARAHGAFAVAAAWGYGTRGELEAARPSYVADTTAQLLGWVRSMARSFQGGRPGPDAERPQEGRS